MSEYWKSTPKYWCKHCKTFVKDTKLETTNHNASPKHQGNLKRFLRDLQRNHDRDEKEKERAKSEVARLNGLVSSTRSKVEKISSASTGLGQSHYSNTTAPKVTELQRKQNLAQLAEMGICIPNELRSEMAMPGEWQVISERIIDPVAETSTKQNTVTIGVRRPLRDEDHEEEEDDVSRPIKRRTGYTFKKQSTEEDDKGLDLLLYNVTQSNITNPTSTPDLEVKQEDVSNDFAQNMNQEKQQSESVVFKSEPQDNNKPLPSSLEKLPETSGIANVIFKKRKVKHIRQK